MNGILLGIQGRPKKDMFTIIIIRLRERKIRIAISVPVVIVLHSLRKHAHAINSNISRL